MDGSDAKNIWVLVWFIMKIVLVVMAVLYLLIVLVLDDGWKHVVDFFTQTFMKLATKELF